MATYELGGNRIIEAVTPDGRTGFDKFGQLMSWTLPDEDGCTTGRMIVDVRGCTCYLCGKGWELTSESLRDQRMIGYDRSRMCHGACVTGWEKLDSYYKIKNALIDAGFLFTTQEEHNPYPYAPPIQHVTVLKNDSNRTDTGHRLTVGRRKRVWEIRYFTSRENAELPALFENIEHTKGFSSPYGDNPEPSNYYVHAWTLEELVDFLSRIRSTIPDTDRNQQSEERPSCTIG